MKATFDLISERWIPCLRPDGTTCEASLLDVLVDSRSILEVLDPSPLVTVALHRLLLAILHRNFGPESEGDWAELWNRGKWDAETLEDYFSRWRHRFDLFHDQRPFYQVPEMADAEIHPVSRLALEMASGNNTTLFDHATAATSRPWSAAQAARYVLACQAFSIGLGKSRPFYLQDAALTRGFTVIVLGNSLFETLALNLVCYSRETPMRHVGEDVPAWEHASPAQPDREGTPPAGYLDYLTWQSRRIHLFPEGNPPVVRSCQVQQNLKPSAHAQDPFKCYRRAETQGMRPLQIRPDRALWRDCHALLQQASSTGPTVFNWLARVQKLARYGMIQAEPAYRFSLLGFGTGNRKADVVLWRHERLPLPLAYLSDSGLLESLGDALNLAERVAGALRKHTKGLARTLLSRDEGDDTRFRGNQGDVDRLAGYLSPEHRYWSRLDVSFCSLLEALPRPAPEQEMRRWAGTVVDTALASFTEVLRGLGESRRVWKASVKAEQGLRAHLNTLTHRSRGNEQEEEANVDATLAQP